MCCLFLFLCATVLWSRKQHSFSDRIVNWKFEWGIPSLFKFMPCFLSSKKTTFNFSLSSAVPTQKVQWSSKQLFQRDEPDSKSWLYRFVDIKGKKAKIMFQFWMTISASFFHLFFSKSFLPPFSVFNLILKTRKVHSFHYIHFAISISPCNVTNILLCFRLEQKGKYK